MREFAISWDRKIREHYDEIAFEYDERKESSYYSTIEEIIREFIPSECYVLDLGCGSGKLLRDLFPRGVGVDLSAKLIGFAHDKRANHDYIVADIKHLPFRELRFPAVVCIDVLEHVDDTEQLINELKRITEIGGIAVMTTANFFFWPLLELLEIFQLKLPEGPHKWIRLRAVTELLEERGFHCSTASKCFGLIRIIAAQKQW